MIGKITIGKSLGGLISYALEDKLDDEQKVILKNRAELLVYNQCFGDKKELRQQFNEVRKLNPKLSRPAMHISLSFPPGEVLDKATLQRVIEDCANELGIDKNQYIAVLHKDTGHQHVHIVVNRVGFNGKTLSDSNNYKKIADCCRKLEQKYNLKQVLSPKLFLPEEKRQIPRMDTRKLVVKEAILLTLLQSNSYSEFKDKMEAKGFEIIRGRGIAFRDEKKMYVKGSDLGYSLSKIEKILQLTFVQKQAIIRQELRKEKQHQTQSPYQLEKDLNLGRLQNISKALEILMRPEHEYNLIPHELIHKKRKKSQHL